MKESTENTHNMHEKMIYKARVPVNVFTYHMHDYSPLLWVGENYAHSLKP